MFYNVRYKGTFGQEWTEKYGVNRNTWYEPDNPDNKYGYKIQNYTGQNTIVTITPPAKQGEMDIQVEALTGYTNSTLIDWHFHLSNVGYTFHGEESGWSNTTTIDLETPTYTPNPTTPEPTENQEIITGVAITVVAISAAIGLLIYLVKRK